MACFANPLNEERRQKIQDDAALLLKEFGRIFLCKYGLAVLLSLKTEERIPWKLDHRPWNSVKRENLASGYLYMRRGSGPGAFGKWKKRFVVERQDYGLDIFPDEEAYLKEQKPKRTLQIAGYRVVDQVSAYYDERVTEITEGLNLSKGDRTVLTGFSKKTFALGHPYRPNLVFQISEAKNGLSCCCFTKRISDDGDMEDEELHARSDWIELMLRCSIKSCPRNKESLLGKAFDMTYERIPSKLEHLEGWKDDGKESQMLVSLLLEGCLGGVRPDILHDLIGPTSIRIAIWYKVIGAMQTVLQKMVDPAFEQIIKASNAVEEKIKKGLEPIRKIKLKIEDKIKECTLKRAGELLAKHITPQISPLLDAFEKPLQTGFQKGRKLIAEDLKISELPEGIEERNRTLDALVRQKEFLNSIYQITSEIGSRLELVFNSGEKAFSELGLTSDAATNFKELRFSAEDLILEVTDSAVFTLQKRIDEGKELNESTISDLLSDLDHDIQVAMSKWMKEVVRKILFGGFRKLLSAVTKPAIEQANEIIPEEMQDFLDVETIIDEVLSLLLEEPINAIVERAYPTPK